jgi:acetyl/propionyl-CoA carboxylase alpha subunit
MLHQGKKILIANRCEIALRIQATCKSLGIKTVAIYGPEDAQATFVYAADEAYPLSLRGFQAYLNQEEILSIALKAGVDAIHPGYGFLSENHFFVKKVIDAGLLWIGPEAQTMQLMGDKAQARALMRRLSVAINEGREFKAAVFDLEAAKECALQVGYPVIIKDALGGGGKAMRRVEREVDFDSAWHAVLSEGKRLGFSGNIIVEKYLVNARHIEVQIAGDGIDVIHLFERECSVQRKHQKIVEEAPARFVPQEVLNRMYATACTIAQSVGYKSIGTVEFLVTPQGEFYFLEVNARLQVEHSVTELTTGLDLIALQMYIAFNGRLPYVQSDIFRRGHAIECRVYAEDPSNNFMPCVGRIEYVQLPRGPFVRVDHDLQLQQEITPFFDPMIAKVTTHGFTRTQALANMCQALQDFMLVGCTTNISFLLNLIQDQAFVGGAFSTHWLHDASVLQALCAQPADTKYDDVQRAAIAAIIHQVVSAATQPATAYMSQQQQQVASAWKNMQWK